MGIISSPTEFIKIATQTAYHYGFEPLESLRNSKQCTTCKKMSVRKVSAADKRIDALYGMLASGISTYYDAHFYALGRPVLFFSVEQVPRTGEVALCLQILGVEKSIAEALLIQTARSLLFDAGYEHQCVRINSLGDRDSVARYSRELTNYLRKRLENMPVSARELLKEHALIALMDLIEHEDELAVRSPSPLEYLSDNSRKHFREIVEYLDMSETPYEIDTRLIGHHHCYSDALFSIELRDESEHSILDAPFVIRGGRYDEFVRRMTKTQVPATGAVIIFKERKVPARIPRPRRSSIPSTYIVQLGFGPKIKSLLLLDTLKQAKISVYQNLTSDSLSAQLREAEALNVPYSLILGQKEYVEGTVIVRDMFSRSQESVPIESLVTYLKRSAR